MAAVKNKTEEVTPQLQNADELKAALEASEKKNLDLTQVVGQLNKELSAMRKQMVIGSSKKAERAEFEHEGKKYCFVVPLFRYGKDTITALDAINSPDILTALVEKGSGVIKQIS